MRTMVQAAHHGQKGLCKCLEACPKRGHIDHKALEWLCMPYAADMAVSPLTRSEALRGGEALGKLANEHVQALRHASHAVDCAPSAAVTQMEWERDVEWGMQQLGSMAASSQSHLAEHGNAEGTGGD